MSYSCVLCGAFLFQGQLCFCLDGMPASNWSSDHFDIDMGQQMGMIDYPQANFTAALVLASNPAANPAPVQAPAAQQPAKPKRGPPYKNGVGPQKRPKDQDVPPAKRGRPANSGDSQKRLVKGKLSQMSPDEKREHKKRQRVARNEAKSARSRQDIVGGSSDSSQSSSQQSVQAAPQQTSAPMPQAPAPASTFAFALPCQHHHS